MESRRWGVALLVALLSTSACVESSQDPLPPRRVIETPTPVEEDALRIGLVATLSGEGVFAGEDALEGADLAVQLMNRESATDAPIELVTLDDHGRVARARTLVKELAASERTLGIVYAGPPEALPALEPVLEEAGIPALLVYGDLYSPHRLTPHVFQMSPPFLWQSRRMARYLLADRRYGSVGALVESSFTGRAAAQSLRVAMEERGRRLTATTHYEPDRSDLGAALRALKARRVEAVVVHGTPAVLPDVFEELRGMQGLYRGTDDARIVTAPPQQRRARRRSGYWRPQIVAWDLALGPRPEAPSFPPGTIAAGTYARGVHYLPIPTFQRFRQSFEQWWGAPPLGLEARAYDAARAIGWASERSEDGEDAAAALEGLRSQRFGGLDVTFGPDDHTSIDHDSVGLWVVPGPDADVRERERLPAALPWVMLGRGFSINGRRTDIESKDWRYLFRDPPPQSAPPPRIARMKFGVTTPRSDPVQ